MPRRLPVKPDRFIGNLFIILVFATLIWVYTAVVVYSIGPLFLKSILATILMGVFHFFFIMVVWCLMMTILGDPGQVPTFWGFHFGDHESKRKRY
jgi:palmitoyltransferase